MQRTYPHNQALLALWMVITYRLSSRKKLKKYNAECIDIYLVINFAEHEIFRSQVTAVDNMFTNLLICNGYQNQEIHEGIIEKQFPQLVKPIQQFLFSIM